MIEKKTEMLTMTVEVGDEVEEKEEAMKDTNNIINNSSQWEMRNLCCTVWFHGVT